MAGGHEGTEDSVDLDTDTTEGRGQSENQMCDMDSRMTRRPLTLHEEDKKPVDIFGTGTATTPKQVI